MNATINPVRQVRGRTRAFIHLGSPVLSLSLSLSCMQSFVTRAAESCRCATSREKKGCVLTTMACAIVRASGRAACLPAARTNRVATAQSTRRHRTENVATTIHQKHSLSLPLSLSLSLATLYTRVLLFKRKPPSRSAPFTQPASRINIM